MFHLQVYVLLMRLLISPPENWLVGVTPPIPPQPDLETALDLLEGNADRIPPLEALKELPDTVPLIRIKHFLTTSLQKQLNHRRTTQVLKGLLYAEHLQVYSLSFVYLLNIYKTESSERILELKNKKININIPLQFNGLQ